MTRCAGEQLKMKRQLAVLALGSATSQGFERGP